MNFYQRHIGDYIKDTAHLSLLEHGVYTRLLDVYYGRERPLEVEDVHRLIGVRTDEERAATDSVLREFFTCDGVTWCHKRCDSDIQDYRDSEPERDERKANQRERQRRSRERRRELFALLREKGEIPPYDTSTKDLVTMLSQVESRDTVTPGARDDTATQYPLPNTHYPIEKIGEPSSPSLALEAPAAPEDKSPRGQFIPKDFELTAERRQVAVAERVQNPEREFQRFVDHWRAASGANARKRDWDSTWRNWCRKAADMGSRTVFGGVRRVDEVMAKLRES